MLYAQRARFLGKIELLVANKRPWRLREVAPVAVFAFSPLNHQVPALIHQKLHVSATLIPTRLSIPHAIAIQAGYRPLKKSHPEWRSRAPVYVELCPLSKSSVVSSPSSVAESREKGSLESKWRLTSSKFDGLKNALFMLCC